MHHLKAYEVMPVQAGQEVVNLGNTKAKVAATQQRAAVQSPMSSLNKNIDRELLGHLKQVAGDNRQVPATWRDTAQCTSGAERGE